ncbi:MAG: prenyltransferase [Gemmatimonadota bacterium]|nr:prenyltransferase [Gemmatimonadota bacterium]
MEGIRRLADPKISLASMASIFLGASLAAAAGPIHLGWLAATVIGIFAIEVAKNASGEIYDWDSGADLAVAPEDRSPFSGGKRVLVDGLLSRRQTWVVAWVGYGIGIAAGFAIAFFREPDVLWLGVAGVALAFFYGAPPLRLAYRGLGELAVALVYGPGIAAGTYLVQRGAIEFEVVAASLPLGILIGAFLWINELPDRRADRAVGKRTRVVRLGRPAAARGFVALLAAAFLLQATLPALGLPAGSLLGLAGAAPALVAARVALAAPAETERIVPAQVATLLAFLLVALGTGIGVLVSGTA